MDEQATETQIPFPLTAAELHLIREWFDNVQDINRIYLEPKDYALAKRVYEALGMRVPHSILSER